MISGGILQQANTFWNTDLYRKATPFAYTAHEEPTTKEIYNLKRNWLSQSIFYMVYSQWDLKGINNIKVLIINILPGAYLSGCKKNRPICFVGSSW